MKLIKILLNYLVKQNLYAEIKNISLFSTPHKLIAFTGFDISINQSGIMEHHGKILKRGSSLLRKAIWTYALPSLRFIPVLNDYYHKKKSKGRSRQYSQHIIRFTMQPLKI